MKFSLFYEMQISHPTRDKEAECFRNCLEQAVLADEVGFDGVWEVEHHGLYEYSHSSAPEIFLSFVAARTRRIRVGHGITLTPYRYNHPIRIAERIAALDILSDGRVDWGSGKSSSRVEQLAFENDLTTLHDQWLEALQVIPRMWKQDVFEWKGRFYDIPPTQVIPKPVQKPHPPIYAACSKPDSAESVGALGIGALNFAVGTDAYLKEKVRRYRAAVERAAPGHYEKTNHFACTPPALVLPDDRKACEYGFRGARFFQESLARYYFTQDRPLGELEVPREFLAELDGDRRPRARQGAGRPLRRRRRRRADPRHADGHRAARADPGIHPNLRREGHAALQVGGTATTPPRRDRAIRALGAGTTLAVLLAGRTAMAAITGSWVAYFENGPTVNLVIRQDGATLSGAAEGGGSPLRGSFDALTGVFTLIAEGGTPCPAGLVATLRPDQNGFYGSWSESVLACPGGPRTCTCVPGPVRGGVRACRVGASGDCCGDGVIGPDEECDDGPEVGGACNGACRLTAEPPCGSDASPAPAGAVDSGDLDRRPLPEWYDGAKFGIMIHWGPFSVPAWAETVLNPEKVFGDPSDPTYIGAPGGIERFMLHNPYAEWYQNSLAIEGSATAEHHRATYGADFAYAGFAPLWEEAIASWDPEQWAELFRRAGARYVVLVTKHHDGYLLWPSATPNPRRSGWHSARDVVGELADAVRRRCLRMGVYYSGGIDWSFKPPPIRNLLDFLLATPPEDEYAAYVDAHWRELIDRYRPSVLWNDITSPAATDEVALFTDYYRIVPDGVVNDRWAPSGAQLHRDFFTPEFTVLEEISAEKWETVRGMGQAFGYNRNEGPEQYGTPEKFIHMLIDNTSKNGNLLLNVGPMADGTIPAPQVEILEAIGQWLAIYGEAIYDTRPWRRFGGLTDAGIAVRFTRSRDGRTVYATLLGTPEGGNVTIEGIRAPAVVRLAGTAVSLVSAVTTGGTQIEIPAGLPALPAHAFAIEPELPAECAGDCDLDGRVSIDELVSGVGIGLGTLAVGECPELDTDANGAVSVAELVVAIGRAGGGCAPLNPGSDL
jgi:alpha-L-fucosidase